MNYKGCGNNEPNISRDDVMKKDEVGTNVWDEKMVLS